MMGACLYTSNDDKAIETERKLKLEISETE